MVRWHDGLVSLCEAAKAARAGLPPVYGAGDRPYAAADPLVVFSELRKHANQALQFIEWGSGVGTMTIMADLIGYRACGIERDARLAGISEQLARQSGSRASFGVGSFVPDWVRPIEVPGVPPEFAISNGGPDGYAAISHKPDDFDVIYVFPHPELIDTVHDLFARTAKPGARLLVYCQSMEILTSTRGPQGATPLTIA